MVQVIYERCAAIDILKRDSSDHSDDHAAGRKRAGAHANLLHDDIWSVGPRLLVAQTSSECGYDGKYGG